MKITINGESKNYTQDQLSVTDLLKEEKVDMPEMVSVELNGSIVDRDQFSSTVVVDGNEVEFLYFMGGGNIA